jgi:RNA polymerase sigma factor (sigma-70 family)
MPTLAYQYMKGTSTASVLIRWIKEENVDSQQLQETVNAAQQGSQEALEEIAEWFLNQKEFFITAYGILRNYEDARDAVAESAIKVCSKISEYDSGKGAFVYWCKVVVKRTALDLRDKVIRRGDLFAGEGSTDQLEQAPSPPSGNPAKTLTVDELRHILDEAERSSGLSERQKAAWQLHRAGDDNSTIAAVLGIETRAVERDKHRAKHKIAEYIRHNYPEWVPTSGKV